MDYDIHDRRHVTYHCVFDLLSPLSHIGETLGGSNITVLKQAKRIAIDGRERSHFVFSSNAFRNAIFRRKGFGFTLDGLGVQVDPTTHHTLFAGGRIDSGTVANIELEDQFRRWLPGLSVLGTAKPKDMGGEKGSQMISGRLSVGDAVLVCYETINYIYQQAPGLIPYSIYSSVKRIMEAREAITADIFSQPSPEASAAYEKALEEELPKIKQHLKSSTACISTNRFYRRDSESDPDLVKYLKAPEQKLIGTIPGLTEEKKKPVAEKQESRFMGDDHLIAPGNQLYSRMDMHGTTVEEGFLCAALLEFAKHPYIGGKSNRGNGHVNLRINYKDHTIGESGILLSVGTDYQQLSDRAQENYRRYCNHLEEFKHHLESADSMPRHLLGGK